jgi:hypothetical protein
MLLRIQGEANAEDVLTGGSRSFMPEEPLFLATLVRTAQGFGRALAMPRGGLLFRW